MRINPNIQFPGLEIFRHRGMGVEVVSAVIGAVVVDINGINQICRDYLQRHQCID